MLGLVGLGKVIGSQKTTPREDRSFFSGFSALARIELCEIPVLGALEISDAADGVAVWKTGFPMTGLDETLPVGGGTSPGFRGRVEDFDMWDAPAAAARLDGNVLVLVIEVLGLAARLL